MHFEGNLAALRAVDERLAERVLAASPGRDLAIGPSKAGPPSLKIGDIAVHSLYDPVREAVGWADQHREVLERSAALVVLGFGLGYHVAELLRRTDRPVTVFEPRLDVFRAALEASDLSAILPRVNIVTACDELSPKGMFGVLRHSPSIGRSPDLFEPAAARLEALRTAAGGFRIAVVGPFYGGSLPVAGYCVAALRELGHEVEFIDNSVYAAPYLGIDAVTQSTPHRDILRVRFGEFASEAAMARLVPFRPDLVLALAQAPLREGALASLREQRIATAMWFVEDHRHMGYWRAAAPQYDHFFAIQRGDFLHRLREAGARNVGYLPMAAAPEVHRKLELSPAEAEEFGSDVSFVGAGYYNRRKLFEGLVDLDFRIWGNEWEGCAALRGALRRDGARVSTEDVVKIFNASRININLHSSSYHEGVHPDGDFVNPRTFEIAACGRFQLVDHRAPLAEFFEIGREIATFGSLAELRAKIAHYLAHPEERDAVAAAGRQRVLRDHTYVRRMESLIAAAAGRGYESPWKARREREDPGALLAEAGPETALGGYLAQFAGARRLDLSAIVREIRSGRGRLSRVERIFLAMQAIGG